MTYLKKYENYVQDMMSIPTTIYTEDTFNDYIPTLKPYYNYIKSLTGVRDLTVITYEEVDNYVGFSFVSFYQRVMVLSDKTNVHLLINNELIPLENPEEIIKIIKSES